MSQDILSDLLRSVRLRGVLFFDVDCAEPWVTEAPDARVMAPASALDIGSWTAHFVNLAAAESRHTRPGGEVVLERMSEMMFVDLLRRYLDGLPEDHRSWLSGLRDRYVGRVLALMHESPTESWTLELLAARVGLSRSALHERFVQFIGMPPMQYLTNWRMQIASQLLTQSNATLASISLEAGYESEAAFSRAFKRAVGVPPSIWRRRHSTSIARRTTPVCDGVGMVATGMPFSD